jgi:hypothetical protein
MVGDALSTSQGSCAVCKFGLVFESRLGRFSVTNESMYAQLEFARDSGAAEEAHAERLRAVTLYLDLAPVSDSLAQLHALVH